MVTNTQSTHSLYTKEQYAGSPSTLCVGCGHNSVSQSISDVCFEMGIDPTSFAKVSGIGCSSKTPAYFLKQSHAFNSVHGRMASVATGALLANHRMRFLGVSGDGDTASIGLGGFIHLCRRNAKMVYLMENNGTYGLTKGQFSATASEDSTLRNSKRRAEFFQLDVCELAINSGATFVARTFSGDRKQMNALLKAALSHNGFAFIDILSPCVTFNNHSGSTKSFDYIKAHQMALGTYDYVPSTKAVELEQESGKTTIVKLHDGSQMILNALEKDFDPTQRHGALSMLCRGREQHELLTGLIYVNTQKETLSDFCHFSPEFGLSDCDLQKIVPQSDFVKVFNSVHR